ncbi:hypothetical protein [Photorhabdus laumondii]|uniref:Photorhabdus luminescens subsp. laumondii TTO1 complete genome segment 8/17 n=1 Tax=Photorhabdus laumondii subsp. laumondii (strain DSM 15139 / CIP 105565 / TT01) TaxID=243265 RepID=Q7N4U7_PHOLL|nr:hypothetical protein [Photorhabdus laumondii]AXG47322.1 hypothetical protein PluTT01m_11445 [Photorhabdus laumondii subsp. laumondii]CAE14511.1 unnamed protein product [Photorhabdus laumondii subsp. laumondii TTO1]
MLIFEMEDIEHWSNFSGDFNPIHYSEKSEFLHNMQQYPVQGMLSLLYVRQQLSQLTSAFTSGILNIDTSFRQYVYTALPHQLRIDTKSKTFKLENPCGKSVLSGNTSVENTMESIEHWIVQDNCQKLTITREGVCEKYAVFRHYFPSVTSIGWFLDALVFHLVINSTSFLNFEHYYFNQLQDYLNQSFTLHTGQAIKIKEDIVNSTILRSSPNICVELNPPLLIKNGPKDYIRIFYYRCLYDKNPIFVSKISIISKMK